jgi:uncharacterized cofD-like protein
VKFWTERITAIVTVTDEGGSSGRLRGEMGVLPPGDLRNCLVALSEAEPLMRRLFQYRFDRGGLSGHAFGNLFIVALSQVLGDFREALRAASKILKVKGEVLPSTLESVVVGAELEGGEKVLGELAISRLGGRIKRVFLDPPHPRPAPGCLEAIEEADLLVLGPGSLFTSILPNLLVPGIARAISRSRAVKVLVVNLMTQPGETDGFRASDHVRVIREQVGEGVVDWAVVNTGWPGEERMERYRSQGAELVEPDVEDLERMGIKVVLAPLVNRRGLVRHDVRRLSRVLRALVPPTSFHHLPYLHPQK